MVEHSAVNRGVVGSSPTRGVATRLLRKHAATKNFLAIQLFRTTEQYIGLHGQAVKTSPFHGGNAGSIPAGVIFRL